MQSEKINIKKITVKYVTYLFLFILILLAAASPVQADTIRMPGNLEDFDYFITYNYTVPGEDLLFHFNELLLFEEMPTFKKVAAQILRGVNLARAKSRHRGNVLDNLKQATLMSYRYKLRNMFKQDTVVRDYMVAKTGEPDGRVSFDLTTSHGLAEATSLMRELGIQLRQDAKGRLKPQQLYSLEIGVNPLFKIQGLNTWKLFRKLNDEKRFTFNMNTFDLDIPFSLVFLSDVTGSVLKSSNFAHELVHEPRLQMLLGILFRLSDLEIRYIAELAPENGAWKKIYNDNAMLNGMFLLCHGLRVRDGRLRLPGGAKSVEFWKRLTGSHPREQPFDFLKTLLTRDNGRLNYFYTLGYFLEPEVRQEVFFQFNAEAFEDFYQLVRLSKKERLVRRNRLKLPQLDDNGIFALLFCLRTKKGKLYFPGGIEHWAAAMGADEKGFQGIVKALVKTGKKKRAAAIRRFTAIYSKFIDRPEILTPEVLRTLFKYYDDYNVMVDFIEQLPLKKPATVTRLFEWAESLSRIKGSTDPFGLRNQALRIEHARLKDGQGRRGLTTALFQSLLAILSHGARYMPGQYDYDQLMEHLMAIPFKAKPGLYDGIFQFLDNRCGLDVDRLEADRSMMNFFLNGIQNPVTTLHDQEYILDATHLLEKETGQILEKQGACKLSHLARVNELLDRFVSSPPKDTTRFEALVKACEKLPLTAAEDSILSGRLAILFELKKSKASSKWMKSVILDIKEKVLLRQLKHLLVTGVYALNAASSNLRVYSNQHFTRLHDFTYHGRGTPWNSCQVSLGRAREVLYHVEGGLSRLRIVLAAPFGEQLCHMMRGDFTAQTTPIIYNNLDLFPLARVGRGQEAVGLLVQLAMDMLKQAETDPAMAEGLKDRFALLTSGYHYRKIVKKLEGGQPKFFPYFRELLRLGEIAFLEGEKPSGSAAWKELEKYREPGTFENLQNKLHLLGSMYYNTYGRLRPYRFNLFPQALSQLFGNGIIGGEMNNEFKIKAAYISYKRGVPVDLLGYLAYRYLVYVSMYYSQKFPNDFYKTYFVYNVYNHLYMNRIINTLKRAGVLKIR